MNFHDILAITEAVLLAAPAGAGPHEVARGIALAQRAHLDGTPLADIRTEAWRYAGWAPPSRPAPAPRPDDRPSPLPQTLRDAGRDPKGTP